MNITAAIEIFEEKHENLRDAMAALVDVAARRREVDQPDLEDDATAGGDALLAARAGLDQALAACQTAARRVQKLKNPGKDAVEEDKDDAVGECEAEGINVVEKTFDTSSAELSSRTGDGDGHSISMETQVSNIALPTANADDMQDGNDASTAADSKSSELGKFAPADNQAPPPKKMRRISQDISEKWRKNYADLVAFKVHHGHTMVPKNQGKLGEFVSIERQKFWALLEHKPSNLTEEKIGMLQELGFCWKAKVGNEWEEQFEKLKEYKERHGTLKLPYLRGKEGPLTVLYNWVTLQRSTYKMHIDGKRTFFRANPERIEKLQSIGFIFDQRANSWYERLDELRLWKDQNGHCIVPKRSGELGLWCQTQRRQFNKLNLGEKSSLTQGKIASLESIGFVWYPLHHKRQHDLYDVSKYYQHAM